MGQAFDTSDICDQTFSRKPSIQCGCEQRFHRADGNREDYQTGVENRFMKIGGDATDSESLCAFHGFRIAYP